MYAIQSRGTCSVGLLALSGIRLLHAHSVHATLLAIVAPLLGRSIALRHVDGVCLPSSTGSAVARAELNRTSVTHQPLSLPIRSLISVLGMGQ